MLATSLWTTFGFGGVAAGWLLLSQFGAGSGVTPSEKAVPKPQRPARAAAHDPFSGSPVNADPFAAPPKADAPANSNSPSVPPSLWVVPHAGRLQQIEATLDQQVDLRFQQEPLGSVVETLAQRFDLPISIDHRALEDLTLATDQPVDLSVTSVTLESAIDTMLEPLGLECHFRNEMLQVTSSDQATAAPLMRIYHLQGTGIDGRAAAQLIQTHIHGDSWYEVGGNGQITPLENRTGSVVVISTTFSVHREIARFLDSLRQGIGKPGVTYYFMPDGHSDGLSGGGMSGGPSAGGMF